MEFSCSDYPDERLIACRNPFLAAEKAATREALLQGNEQEFDLVVAATKRNKRDLRSSSRERERSQPKIALSEISNHQGCESQEQAAGVKDAIATKNSLVHNGGNEGLLTSKSQQPRHGKHNVHKASD